MDTKTHWESIYSEKSANQVSWFQPEARVSLELIQSVEPRSTASIIDVGGGASLLVDGLLRAGYRRMTVLDLSGAALHQSQLRLGASAESVTWREADVLTADLPRSEFDVWHDRAVFHFLTDAGDRERYVAQVRQSVRPGGHVLVATFAHDGPVRCSGLEVSRYTPSTLHEQFGAGFRMLTSVREEHVTPSGARQAFVYCLCRYEPLALSNPAA